MENNKNFTAMKTLIYNLIALLFVLSLVSCDKNEADEVLPVYEINFGFDIPASVDMKGNNFEFTYSIDGENKVIKTSENASGYITAKLKKGTRVSMNLKVTDKATEADKTGQIEVWTFLYKDSMIIKENICKCNGTLEAVIQ